MRTSVFLHEWNEWKNNQITFSSQNFTIERTFLHACRRKQELFSSSFFLCHSERKLKCLILKFCAKYLITISLCPPISNPTTSSSTKCILSFIRINDLAQKEAQLQSTIYNISHKVSFVNYHYSNFSLMLLSQIQSRALITVRCTLLKFRFKLWRAKS